MTSSLQILRIQMNQQSLSENESRSAVVAELLQRRATVMQWLERLEAQRGTVSEKILARVRADYEQRLQDTLDALSDHRDSIAAQLEDANARHSAAEQQQTSAQEALEEGKLRNAIGELDEQAWSRERRELEEAVEEASAEEQAAREESERLRDLVEQFAETTAPIEDLPEGPSVTERPASVQAPSEAEAAFATEPEPDPDLTIEQPAAAEQESANDPKPVSFLTDIDRAISEEVDDPVDEPQADGDANPLDEEYPSEETAPKPGLKCAECGYTNDLSAWFCGVCGADIG